MASFNIGNKVREHNSDCRGTIILIYGEPKRCIVRWKRKSKSGKRWIYDGEQAHNFSELLKGW